MSQNEPNAKQLRVIDLLLIGKTVVEAAKLAGVGRSTVHRWKRKDRQFIGALNTARSERRERHVLELESLVESAISTVKKAVGDGDVKASLVLLDKLGCMRPNDVIEAREKAAMATVVQANEELLAELIATRNRPRPPQSLPTPAANGQAPPKKSLKAIAAELGIRLQVVGDDGQVRDLDDGE